MSGWAPLFEENKVIMYEKYCHMLVKRGKEAGLNPMIFQGGLG
jgi:hypothetical protein